ncbi:MAG TPA: three-Cys-motif partner protein TcmP [Ignavibacteriaceae bacterium]|nr:three-Cys-motif partner protein TcmP [Ignavibacteriaceae bacterium]
MSNVNFFDEKSEQSKVKTLIVSKYFVAWAKVIIATAKRNKHIPKIAYIDLFAGPGRYNDGTKSTPVMILERALYDTDLKNSLVSVFNDANKEYANSLREAVDEIEGINQLKYSPIIKNEEITEGIVKEFEEISLIPTLLFVDPWGYKGLSLKLISSVLKDWGCDSIFFFNYTRINMGLSNDLVETHINALFGEVRADLIRQRICELKPEQREIYILEQLTLALMEMGGTYTLPFVFKNEGGRRTSHHLIFTSKNFKGYEIMKEIMARESSLSEQGVASFGYNPADINTPLLFELSRPLDDLGDLLLKEFKGKVLTMNEIYLAHNVGKPYIARNYKTALRKLESENKIITNPPPKERKRIKGEVTFGPDVQVFFS